MNFNVGWEQSAGYNARGLDMKINYAACMHCALRSTVNKSHEIGPKNQLQKKTVKKSEIMKYGFHNIPVSALMSSALVKDFNWRAQDLAIRRKNQIKKRKSGIRPEN